MKCPKCEEGTIEKVILKMTGEDAQLCDYCETIWLKGETIRFNTGQPFNIVKQGSALEYTLADTVEQDQDNESVKYTHAR